VTIADETLRVAACTIVAHNYLPRASVLADSMESFHPEIEMFTVVIDHPDLVKNLDSDKTKVLSVDEIGWKGLDYRRQASIYDLTEFATSVKPYVLEHLLSKYDVVLYLDPDTQIFSRIDLLIEATWKHGWSITPHVTRPYLDRVAGPPEREIMGAGIYNLGYIGVSKNALPMLHWWQDRLDLDAIVDQPNQLFTDQRWIDLATPIFRPHVILDTCFNVAYWNLDHRHLSINEFAEYLVDGVPLAFFHFSGYDPSTPHLMCGYQDQIPRVSLSDNPLFYELFNQYSEKIHEAELMFEELPSYGWGECSPGVELGRHIRRLLRLELIASAEGRCAIPPSPFILEEVDDFYDWLRGPSPIDHRPIPRHALAKLKSLIHDDARLMDMHLPDVAREYERWFDKHLLPAEPISQLIGNKWALHHEHTSFFSLNPQLKKGVDVIGYVNSEVGVGEAARRVVTALGEVGVSVGVASVPAPESQLLKDIDHQMALSHRTIVLAVNADQVPHVVPYLPKSQKKQKVIGQWFWELERAPSWMVNAFRFLDEVWVATEFMAGAVKSVAPRKFPVKVMPIPLTVSDYEPVHRNTLQIDHRFTFGFTFDFLSVMKRKNPLGLVTAYIEAFPEEDDTHLIIKTINANQRPIDRELLLWMTRNRRDITVVRDSWNSNAVLSFLRHIDCYVSMHRSEGLGLTIAEAMSQGTPVITTGYSGNMDFTNSFNSYLIPYEMVQVGSDAGGYDPSAEWAEPDIAEASKLMRRVYENRSEASEIGVRGQKFIEQNFSYSAVGMAMKKRLSEIGLV
jgi:glycosyltransferase involved in cell wall biosynthesis